MTSEQVEDLATTAVILINEGNTDPNVDEIADAHWDSTITSVMRAELEDNLPRIKAEVEESYDEQVHLVNGRYYDRFRDRDDLTDAEARKCLPMGRGNASKGLRVPESSDDPILQADRSQHTRAGIQKAAKHIKKATRALQTGDITAARAGKIAEELRPLLQSALQIRRTLHASDHAERLEIPSEVG